MASARKSANFQQCPCTAHYTPLRRPQCPKTQPTYKRMVLRMYLYEGVGAGLSFVALPEAFRRRHGTTVETDSLFAIASVCSARRLLRETGTVLGSILWPLQMSEGFPHRQKTKLYVCYSWVPVVAKIAPPQDRQQLLLPQGPRFILRIISLFCNNPTAAVQVRVVRESSVICQWYITHFDTLCKPDISSSISTVE